MLKARRCTRCAVLCPAQFTARMVHAAVSTLRPARSVSLQISLQFPRMPAQLLPPLSPRSQFGGMMHVTENSMGPCLLLSQAPGAGAPLAVCFRHPCGRLCALRHAGRQRADHRPDQCGHEGARGTPNAAPRDLDPRLTAVRCVHWYRALLHAAILICTPCTWLAAARARARLDMVSQHPPAPQRDCPNAPNHW